MPAGLAGSHAAVAALQHTARPSSAVLARAATMDAPAARSQKSKRAKDLGSSERTVGGGTVRLTSQSQPDGSTVVTLDATQVPNNDNLVLHWGASSANKPPHDWEAPPESMRPHGTTLFDDGKAARSPIGARGGPLRIEVPSSLAKKDGSPATMLGIVVRVAGGAEDEWLHAEDGMGDLTAPLKPPPPPPPPGIRARSFAERCAKEESGGGMNLFRRFCLVSEYIGDAFADPGPGSAGAILAWLRLSNSRQLPWYARCSLCGYLLPMCIAERCLAV